MAQTYITEIEILNTATVKFICKMNIYIYIYIYNNFYNIMYMFIYVILNRSILYFIFI